MFTTRKTVDSVISVFNRTLADLKAVADQEDAEAARQDQIAQDALTAKAVAEAESARATSIASKLEGLLG